MGQTPFVNHDSSAAPRTYAFRRAPLSTRPARGHVADYLDDKETSRRETVFGPVDIQTLESHFFSQFFLEKLGYTYACAFNGYTHRRLERLKLRVYRHFQHPTSRLKTAVTKIVEWAP